MEFPSIFGIDSMELIPFIKGIKTLPKRNVKKLLLYNFL